MAPGKIKLDVADDYLEKLRTVKVLADMAERKKMLEHGIAEVAQKIQDRLNLPGKVTFSVGIAAFPTITFEKSIPSISPLSIC